MDGALLIDKPAGPTSHDVVWRLRRALGVRRAGHAGTLDPFATGLLVVLLGRATRLTRFLGGADKLYEGVVLLGLSTDTDDITGRPLSPARPVEADHHEIALAAGRLAGRRMQRPPTFSAKKVGGLPAHRRARRGRPVELEPVPVTVHSFELAGFDPPRLRFRALVSAGCYIRALARDLGAELGTGGCLESLRRLGSGPLSIEQAVSPELSAQELLERVVPIEEVPLGLETVVADAAGVFRLSRGQSIQGPWAGPPGPVRLLDERGRLVGVGMREIPAEGEPLIRPDVVLVAPRTAEDQP